MARPKAFNEGEALAAAMEVFWRTGYERASLDLLLQAMGISKQSLYDTFGDKRALYLKALAHYREQTLTSMRAMFASARKARDGFSRLLFGLSAESEEQHARGCLLLSANLERETGDRVIAQFLRENQSAVEQIFAQAIAEGQTSGELSKALNPEALARFFAVTIQGMRAMARLKSDRRALRQVAKVALAALEAK
ncbi:MAG TPA: TetR/AcrR family transcriptional regulator [Vicinamibacterales bacterium]|nr:TetR/AcrR family transcriptional regulator [Vicinamibacterales bacterium]